MSLPSRERGLKYRPREGRFDLDVVAPFTGAWIEIEYSKARIFSGIVAPFTGAWIEICVLSDSGRIHPCRSLHGSVD